MSNRKPRSPLSLPWMMMETAFASWETIARRNLMMMSGTCSPAEYIRMMQEKMTASARSAAKLTSFGAVPTWPDLLAPWHVAAKANARRLRRK